MTTVTLQEAQAKLPGIGPQLDARRRIGDYRERSAGGEAGCPASGKAMSAS